MKIKIWSDFIEDSISKIENQVSNIKNDWLTKDETSNETSNLLYIVKLIFFALNWKFRFLVGGAADRERLRGVMAEDQFRQMQPTANRHDSEEIRRLKVFSEQKLIFFLS